MTRRGVSFIINVHFQAFPKTITTHSQSFHRILYYRMFSPLRLPQNQRFYTSTEKSRRSGCHSFRNHSYTYEDGHTRVKMTFIHISAFYVHLLVNMFTEYDRREYFLGPNMEFSLAKIIFINYFFNSKVWKIGFFESRILDV